MVGMQHILIFQKYSDLISNYDPFFTIKNHISEVVRSFKLGTVWDYVQLISGPRCSMIQPSKIPNIA